MKVIYRMCDIPSTNLSPLFQDNKPRLNRFCLKSFLKAFEGVGIDITFLCDYCKPETIDMIKELCPYGEIIHTAKGINETMLIAYRMAYNQSDDILFQECDYYWLPNTGQKLIDGVRELALVSPYDHRNFYIDRSIHSSKQTIELVGEQHWRTAERNTMTFAIQNEYFKECYESFLYYGYLDNDVWKDKQLWTPIPTLATHMVTDYLSPGIDWYSLWKNQ